MGNESKNNAAVHCVIIGFGFQENQRKMIYNYETLKGESLGMVAEQINSYLVDAPDVILNKRSSPISQLKPIRYGSKPADGGNLVLSEAERLSLIDKYPQLNEWIRPYIGTTEFLYNLPRWCLWLKEAPPSVLNLKEVKERIVLVKRMREESTDANTQHWASFPSLFQTDRQPLSDYLAIPEVSSENRRYFPVGFLKAETIASNLLYTVDGARLFEFGILSSSMHKVWLETAGGRMKSDPRYSSSLVYNNFPIPEQISKSQLAAIDNACNEILTIRQRHKESNLAALYDTITMPIELVKAHQNLDKCVDAVYGKRTLKSETERLQLLFETYQMLKVSEKH